MQRVTLVVIVLLVLGAVYVSLAHRGAQAPKGPLPAQNAAALMTPDPNDPVLSDVLTPQNMERIFRQVRDGNLPIEKRLLFARAMARVGFSETAYAGESVGQVIADQRAREQKRAGHAPKPHRR